MNLSIFNLSYTSSIFFYSLDLILTIVLYLISLSLLSPCTLYFHCFMFLFFSFWIILSVFFLCHLFNPFILLSFYLVSFLTFTSSPFFLYFLLLTSPLPLTFPIFLSPFLSCIFLPFSFLSLSRESNKIFSRLKKCRLNRSKFWC